MLHFGRRRLWDCQLVGELLRHTVVASASAARKCIHPHGNSNRCRCPDSRQLRADGGTCNVCAGAGFYVSLSNKRTNERIIFRPCPRSPSQMSVEVVMGSGREKRQSMATAMSTLKASAQNCAFSDSVIAVVLNSDISNSVRGGPVKISPTSSDSALY